MRILILLITVAACAAASPKGEFYGFAERVVPDLRVPMFSAEATISREKLTIRGVKGFSKKGEAVALVPHPSDPERWRRAADDDSVRAGIRDCDSFIVITLIRVDRDPRPGESFRDVSERVDLFLRPKRPPRSVAADDDKTERAYCMMRGAISRLAEEVELRHGEDRIDWHFNTVDNRARDLKGRLNMDTEGKSGEFRIEGVDGVAILTGTVTERDGFLVHLFDVSVTAPGHRKEELDACKLIRVAPAE